MTPLRSPHPDRLVDELGPERAFVAVLLLDSVEAARQGDRDARRWLERCAVRWVCLALDGLGETVIARLLARLPPGPTGASGGPSPAASSPARALADGRPDSPGTATRARGRKERRTVTTTTNGLITEWVVAPGVERLDPTHAGFWRSVLRPSYAGEVWANVSARVRAGELGAAARLTPLARGRLYELRVYVADVSDRDAVLAARRVLLRELGFKRPIAAYDWAGRRRWYDRGAEATTPRELWRRR